MALRVLILEDEAELAEVLREHIEGLGFLVHIEVDPQAWRTAVAESDCDLIVSDLKGGISETAAAGDEAVDALFSERFVPIVIHSSLAGLTEHFTPEVRSHPFLQLEQKGQDSIARVKDHLMSFRPVATELRRVRDEIMKVSHETLTVTVKSFSGVTLGDWAPLLGHVVRRRIAATFDYPGGDASSLRPIERYLLPPIAPFLLTGDILRRKGVENPAPGDLCLVLTPSCDLVWTTTAPKRRPKVERVLVAMSASIGKIRERLPELRRAPKKELPDQAETKELLRHLSQGDISAALIALPAIPGCGKVPLVFDLKNLGLLNVTEIDVGYEAPEVAAITWIRVGSQDSPFREQIASAICSVLGRPALPEIDYSEMAEELFNLLNAH